MNMIAGGTQTDFLKDKSDATLAMHRNSPREQVLQD